MTRARQMRVKSRQKSVPQIRASFTKDARAWNARRYAMFTRGQTLPSHLHIVQVILLTAMEYMREETDEKEEASTKTQTAWQKKDKPVNWANQIKTFGEKNQ